MSNTIQEKIAKRHLANVRILKHLTDIVEHNPDLRFGQILFNWKLVQWENTDDGIKICDPFFEESVDTLKRLIKIMSELNEIENESKKLFYLDGSSVDGRRFFFVGLWKYGEEKRTRREREKSRTTHGYCYFYRN